MQGRRPGRDDDPSPGIEQLLERVGRQVNAEVEGEIDQPEDERHQARRRRLRDLLDFAETLRGLDQRQHAERPARKMALPLEAAKLLVDRLYGLRLLDMRHDDRVDVRIGDRLDVLEQPGADAAYANHQHRRLRVLAHERRHGIARCDLLTVRDRGLEVNDVCVGIQLADLGLSRLATRREQQAS